LPIAATAVGDVAAMLAAENHAFVTPLEDAALAAAIDLARRGAARQSGAQISEGDGGVR
jgi:hypothetical protein